MDDWYTSSDPGLGGQSQHQQQQHSSHNQQHHPLPNNGFGSNAGGRMYGGVESFTPPPSGGVPGGLKSLYGSSQGGYSGSIGSGSAAGYAGGYGQSLGGAAGGAGEFDNEPPLLEELGINFDHIWAKTRCVRCAIFQICKALICSNTLYKSASYRCVSTCKWTCCESRGCLM
eukprot:5413-Heterococcus_DN1.PRE.2